MATCTYARSLGSTLIWKQVTCFGLVANMQCVTDRTRNATCSVCVMQGGANASDRSEPLTQLLCHLGFQPHTGDIAGLAPHCEVEPKCAALWAGVLREKVKSMPITAAIASIVKTIQFGCFSQIKMTTDKLWLWGVDHFGIDTQEVTSVMLDRLSATGLFSTRVQSLNGGVLLQGLQTITPAQAVLWRDNIMRGFVHTMGQVATLFPETQVLLSQSLLVGAAAVVAGGELLPAPQRGALPPAE